MNIAKLVGVLLVITLLAGCGGEDARKAKYYEKGKSYFEQGDYDKAKVELKNVLQIDPKFADAHYLFGELEEKRKNLRGAYIHFYKAAELDESNLDARNKLARLYLLSGNFDKAQEELDKIKAKDPQSPHINMLELLIAARKGETDKAIDIANSILSTDKKQADAIFILSNLYLKKDDFDNAIKVLSDGVKNNPDNIALRLQLGGIYAMQKDYSAAEKMLKQIISLKPDDFGFRQRLAKFYINIKDYDKAEKALRDAVSLNPEDTSRKLMLVEFLAKYRNVKSAEEELLAAIKSYPDAFDLRFAQAKLYEKVKPEQVDSIYKGIIDMDGLGPDGLKARVSLAKNSFEKKEYGKVMEYVEEVLKENPKDAQALILKGKVALAKDDLITAIAAFRAVIKDQPELVEASRLLAVAHMRNNEPELAKETLIRNIELAESNPETYLNYAQYLIGYKSYEDANKEIDKALKIAPANIEALKMKLNVASLLKDKEMIVSTIDAIKKYHPNDAIGFQKSGNFNLAMKKYDEAIRDYEKALSLSGKLLPDLASITKVYLAKKDHASAIRRLEKEMNARPKNPIPLELLGEVYLDKGNYDKAKKYITKAIDLNPKWSLPYSSLANVYLKKGDTTSAISTYQSALKAIPDDVSLLARLAQIYERKRDFDKAAELYERILAIKPGDSLASNNLAAILSDIRGDAESLEKAKELAKKFEKSNQPGFLDTLGWIYVKTGDYEKAVEILSKVVDSQPQIALFQYHLGMAYYRQGNNAKAKLHFGKALESGQEFKGKDEVEKIMSEI